mgnify:CR=1 FL=1
MATQSHHQHVDKQFGDQAGAYLSSTVHARGRDLERLNERLSAHPQARVLDLDVAPGTPALLPRSRCVKLSLTISRHRCWRWYKARHRSVATPI